MKRLDVFIIALVIIVSLTSLQIFKTRFNKNFYEKYVEIKVDGKIFKTMPLNNDNQKVFTIKTDLGTNVVKIEKGKVSIIEADCRDKICVKDGPIEKPGEMLVCLPHKLVIEIKGKKALKAEVDEISY
ncbi:hypothetical protein SAMN02745883_01062 [Caminicella sporogenes DSM 14501]|uniref:Uncharacterized protein n=1 Tax=Caminicella sporogenes DSM 14501 TaxID=1121266 RepID=A0A1M6P196_9FIRM|nr:NusG domain II-containing protein [Caminicella sporogenes]RKD21567.1 hypothetical protein BET04_07535 [Caminicella sporogenes]SHK01688.1 hypothetical protein SAMN02745883_01062 [Caminicella sporogenes DSM 14501]